MVINKKKKIRNITLIKMLYDVVVDYNFHLDRY